MVIFLYVTHNLCNHAHNLHPSPDGQGAHSRNVFAVCTEPGEWGDRSGGGRAITVSMDRS